MREIISIKETLTVKGEEEHKEEESEEDTEEDTEGEVETDNSLSSDDDDELLAARIKLKEVRIPTFTHGVSFNVVIFEFEVV